MNELKQSKHRKELKQLKQDQISDVVLIGGSTRIPKVKEIIQDYFPNHKLIHKIDADTAVAWGAAIHGAELENIRDVTPLDLGLRSGPGGKKMAVVIPKNTQYPVKIEKSMTNPYDNIR